MKSHSALPTCLLLLLWTFAVFVSCQEKTPDSKILTVNELADGIKLICLDGYHLEAANKSKYIELSYNDENTGEYECKSDRDDEGSQSLKIFVKFRTCDNCIEVDAASISGMIIGDVVATIVVGVGVYLIASNVRTGPAISNKKSKSSDRQHLVSESRGATSDHYQPLRPRGGQKDTYDELVHRR